MKRLLKCLLILLWQLCWVAGNAQRKNISFEHIGNAEGLSQSNIFCILQDSRGFMWFGTWDGLNKYDGYKFTVYKNKPGDSTSISNNYINHIFESKDGKLWIATNNGLNCFDRKKEQFRRFKNDPENLNSISDNSIYTGLEDAEGRIWAGTNAGLDRYDPVTGKFEHFNYKNSGLGKGAVQFVYQDSRNQLWVSVAENGLSLFNSKTKSFSSFRHSEDVNSISSNTINAIFEDSRHRLWFGTHGGGLDLFETTTGVIKHFKHDENNANSLAKNVVLAINEDDEHNLWISTENGGLSIFNYEKTEWFTYRHDEIDKQSISNNSIYSIYRDTKNDMWLGNFAGWLDVALSDKLLFTHYKHTASSNSLSNNQVLSIREDSKNKIWIGTDGGGLNEFDPQTNQFTHYRHQKNNSQTICGDYVLNTMEDRRGNLWVGTYLEGITVLNANRKVIKHFRHDAANPASLASNNVWKLFEDSEGKIWIGTSDGGLDLLNDDGKTFTHYQNNEADPLSISGNSIIEIFEDSKGNLWVGTEGDGLNLFNKQTNTFTRYLHQENKNSISDNHVNSICEDYEHHLWVGTMNGLNMLDTKTGFFVRYNSEGGLAGDYVFGILEDSKHSLWISTNKGLSRFNTITKVFENFSMSDGLQSTEYKQLAFCKSTTGMMYFGGINGFNQFLPENIKKISFEPPLVLTGFNVFNKQVPIEIDEENSTPLKESITEAKEIILPYSNSVFSFEFALLNYTSEEKKQYAYMLEGFDNSWIEAGTARSATYTNLDPGNYVFKVRAFDNKGKLSSRITEIKLTIKPPFWLTWWFKLLMLVSLICTAVGFYRVRINAVKKQQQKLQRQVEVQTHQLLLSAQEEQRARKEAEKAHQAEKLANKQLEASEQRYSNLFHESPQPMWVYDIETLKFVQVNKAAIAHYGYSEQEFLKMTIVDIRPEDENCYSILAGKITSRKNKITFNGRFKHRIKTGELIEVEIYSNPITFNQKEYRLIIAVDITEKVLVENKITKAIIKTQEDERYEIGGELHDNVCQILASSQLSIGLLKDYLPEKMMPHYLQGKKYITMALEEIRNLSHRLAPVFFDGMPLQEAFQHLCNSFNAGGQYNVSLYFYKTVNQDLISREIQLNLYRILQEQLRNIVKYSHATDISIDVFINENMELVMQTSDDGVGFNPGTTKTGIGLANMKRRAEVFSGNIHVDSSPGNGCNIIITIPLSETLVQKMN